MRGISSVIEDVVALINERSAMNLDGKIAYSSDLMDSPLTKPTVAVGLDSVSMRTDKISAFGGRSGNDSLFGVPCDITLSLDIYIPREYHGIYCFDAITYIAEKVLKSTALTVQSIECDRIKYDNTFMCMILPARLKLFDRICGDTTGTMI